MSVNVKIKCPVCEWQPDGHAHWRCSCGHSWNTFDTRAKCPSCEKQWETTGCPGCRKSTPHEQWYKDELLPEKEYSTAELELRSKKNRLENRLIGLGIKNKRVTYLAYLDHSKEIFQTPHDAACRLLILYGIAYSVHNLDERLSLINWFKRENLWGKVSDKEQSFLLSNNPEDEQLIDLSYSIEGALTLGWALGIIDDLPALDQQNNDEEMNSFLTLIPKPGEATTAFFEGLSYRPLNEIYEENLLNEIITGHFRDLYFLGKEDETNIERMTSFQRHLVLNWLRQFSGKEWDDTSTDT